MQVQKAIKPNQAAFVKWGFAKGFIALLVVFAVAYALAGALLPYSVLVFPAAFIALSALLYYSLTIRYRKEAYFIQPGRIIVKAGGIVHDRETELVIRNVTHVKLVRPWLEYRLFGTGRIIIELAGSAIAEAVVKSVDDPEGFYSRVMEIMKENGFGLNKKELVQKEKPSMVGVFFQTLGLVFIAAFFLLFSGAGWVVVLLVEWNPLFGAAAVLTAGLLLLVFLGIRFMDLLMRQYFIYDDTIVYSEGFLTKVDAFIPIENLADSEVTQTLVDKIFGLYHVKVSCQGAAHEIFFYNIRKGPLMEKNIDALINQTSSLVGTGKKEASKEVKETKLAPGKTLPMNVEKEFSADYKMDMVRSFAPIGLGAAVLFMAGIVLSFFSPAFIFMAFLVLFFAFIGAVATAIRVSCTDYSIKGQGMKEKFDFLNRLEVEFSNDKITGVIFRKNFIDEWFNTFSINFWSIGAARDINFSNINEQAGLREKVLAKFGITGKEAPIYTQESRFGYIELVKAHIGFAVVLVAVLAGMLAYAPAVPVLYLVLGVVLAGLALYMVYLPFLFRTSKICFYKHYVHFQFGIFFKSHYYALYDNVKDITTVRYPFSSLGLISFNVAGEAVVGQQQARGGQNRGALVSHHFVMHFVPRIQEKDELIDLVFYKRPPAEELAKIEANLQAYTAKNLAFSKPMAANSLFWPGILLGIASVVLIGLAAPGPLEAIAVVVAGVLFLDVFILGWIFWSVKVTSYAIQPYRVLAKSGILYKRQTSIVFTKIDHLKSFEGLTNKIFRNGSIVVHTTGSSRPEIVIYNIPNYRKFYSTLEKYY
jgi:membrane protein YdbS with pleckstrin-like domain